MLKQPMNWRWHTAIGIFSFISLIALYSFGSARLEQKKLDEVLAEKELEGSRSKFEEELAKNPYHDKLATILPSWGRLYEKGWKEVTKKNSKHNELIIIDVGAGKFAGDELTVKTTKRVVALVAEGKAITGDRIKKAREVRKAMQADSKRELTEAEGDDIDAVDLLEKVPELMSLAENDRLAAAASLDVHEARGPYESYLVFKKSKLKVDMWATFLRFLKGLIGSIIIALPLGLLMGCYAPIEAYFQPLLAFLAKIPATLLYGVFLVLPLIGGTDHMNSAMIIFGVAPTLAITVYLAAKFDVPEELLYKARTLGATEIECIYDVILKLIFPRFLDGVRLAVGPALIFLFAVELLRGEEGIGCFIRVNLNKGMIALPIQYLYIMLAALLGLAIDSSLRFAQRKLCPWFVK